MTASSTLTVSTDSTTMSVERLLPLHTWTGKLLHKPCVVSQLPSAFSAEYTDAAVRFVQWTELTTCDIVGTLSEFFLFFFDVEN